MPTTPNLLGSAQTEQKLRALARELVQNIRPEEDILSNFDLTADELTRLSNTASFQLLLKEAIQEWDGVENIKGRIAVKAAVLVETALPDLFKELTNKQEPLSSRTALLQSLAKLGGLGQEKQEQRTGDVFRLELNFGKDQNVVIENASPTKTIDAEPIEVLAGDD
jgi:hypothetical protein